MERFIRPFGLVAVGLLVFMVTALWGIDQVSAQHAAVEDSFASSPALSGPARSLAVVDVCGEITTDTTWAGGNIYVANACNVIVNPGVTLTIQEGAIVKFGGNCYLSYDNNCALAIKGTLRTQGTAANPVIFTSLKDDNHGDDTNGDGPSLGSPGQWYGLHFMPASQGDMSHTEVYYAGSGVYGRWDGLIYLSRAQIYVNDATLSLQSSEVAYSLKTGIALYGANTQATLDYVRVISNTGAAESGYLGGIYQHTLDMDAVYHNLTLEDNSRDVVALNWLDNWNTFSGDVILDGAPLMPYPTSGGRKVPAGYALTLSPGTLLRFGNFSSRIIIENGAHLTATGAIDQPIVFAAEVDGSTGYDGKWDGLYIDTTASASLEHVEMRQGGGGYYQPAILWVRSSDVTLRDLSIHHSWNDGLRVSGGASQLTLENVTLHDNTRDGLVMGSKDGQVTVNGGAIHHNGSNGVYLHNAAYSGEEKPQDQTLLLDGVDVHDNTAAGLYIKSGGSQVTLKNVNLTNQGGAAIRQHPDNDSPVFVNTSLSGNQLNGISLESGYVEAARHWGAGWPGLPYVAENTLYVRNTGALSLEPGLTLRLPVGYGISVYGSLTALGMAEMPIRFWGIQQSPGGWDGIEFHEGSTGILQHCEIAYGGREYWGNLSPMLRLNTSGTVIVQDCALHTSYSHGIYAGVDGAHFIHQNRFYAIPSFGANISSAATSLDARFNWWGHASGPFHTTLNPDGQGVKVGDNVIFDPWLTEAPVTPSGVVVEIRGPGTISPGQTVDYALTYANHTTATIQNAVLVFQMPSASSYITSTHEGRYWIDRQQIFWRLGDLLPETQGTVSAKVRYRWGLAADYTDTSIAVLVGSNLNQSLFDLNAYLAYEPTLLTGSQPLSEAEFAAERAASPDLQTLYDQALADGFVYGSAEWMTISQGSPILQAILIQPDRREVRFLRRQGDTVNTNTYSQAGLTIADTTGSVSMGLDNHDFTFSGGYVEAPTSMPGVLALSAQCSTGTCVRNCLMAAAAKCMIPDEVGEVVTVLNTVACVDPTSVDCRRAIRDAALAAAKAAPVVGCVLGGVDCLTDCNQDKNTHCCTGAKYIPPSGVRGGMMNFFGIRACELWECNPTLGSWAGMSKFTYCAMNQRCVAGVSPAGGCKSCQDEPSSVNADVCSLAGSGSGVDCKDSSFRRASDPNEKFGPQGDLLPGQLVTYTITYENEGVGIAYGVYVVDILSESFDDSTLAIQGNGRYLAPSHTLLWDVGELAPKGEPGSSGAITFSVRLRGDLAGGTVLANQAVVYFPSVPEVTPTNAVVNVVQPAVAHPQAVTTSYVTPLAITLSGEEVSAAPLTYQVVEPPSYGVLSGAPPNLSYTPMQNYSGPDRFSFVVNNGLIDSRPADVHITITPGGDSTPPQLTWFAPAAGTVITPTLQPVFTGPGGTVYTPAITLVFSEPLNPESINSATLLLSSSQGDIPLIVYYDSLLRRVTAYPSTPLEEGQTYTITATTSIQDAAGNPLAASRAWEFQTQAALPPVKQIYLPILRR